MIKLYLHFWSIINNNIFILYNPILIHKVITHMTIVFFISAFIKVNAVKVQLLKLYQFFFDKLEILDENHDCKLIYLFHTSDLDVFIYLLMTYIII